MLSLYYKRCSEVKACTKVSCTGGVTLKQHFSQFVCCSLRSCLMWCTAGKRSGLCCIRFKLDDSLSTLSKYIKQRAVTEFLTLETQSHIRIHERYQLFLVNILWHKCSVSLGEKIKGLWQNLDLNNQLQSGRSVTATCDLNGQKLTDFFNRISRFLKEP
jgi:hypothetical protein